MTNWEIFFKIINLRNKIKNQLEIELVCAETCQQISYNN